MALGDSGFRSNGGSTSSAVKGGNYYSRLKIRNANRQNIAFEFTRGMLKFKIEQDVADNTPRESVIDVSMGPQKALILKGVLEEFLKKMEAGEPIDPTHAYGVTTGLGEISNYIAFKTTGNRQDVPEHMMVLGKIDSAGTIVNAHEFVFGVDHDCSIEWTDFGKQEFFKHDEQFIPIKCIILVLTEYTNTCSGATGASTMDIGRDDFARLTKSLDPIYEKLGIEKTGYKSQRENFFSKNNSGLGPSNPVNNAMNPPEEFDIDDMIGDY